MGLGVVGFGVGAPGVNGPGDGDLPVAGVAALHERYAGRAVYAEEAVLDEAAVPLEDEEEQEEVVEKFREFIDNVNPEDFAS